MTIWPRRELRVLATLLGALGCLAGAVPAIGLRWQHTESLPRGLYRVDRRASIRRGSVVLWCLDAARGTWARTRGYLTRGSCPGEVEPLGKVVLAMAGDTIDWSPRGVRLNGRLVRHTAPVWRDRAGARLVPAPFGQYVIEPGTVWLYSPYTERSLDSRYFGPIATASIRTGASLLWAF